MKKLLNKSLSQVKKFALIIKLISLGINLDGEIWFTCGSGVTASVLNAAFYQVGLHKTSVYDGSWSEWATDKTNPVGVVKNTQ